MRKINGDYYIRPSISRQDFAPHIQIRRVRGNLCLVKMYPPSPIISFADRVREERHKNPLDFVAWKLVFLEA